MVTLSVIGGGLIGNEADYKILLFPFICFCLKCGENVWSHRLSMLLGSFQVSNITQILMQCDNNTLIENIFYKTLYKNNAYAGRFEVSDFTPPRDQIHETTPIHYLANNSQELIKCAILGGIIFTVSICCYATYSWTFAPKQPTPDLVLRDLGQAVHQNRLAIHDLNAVVESMRIDNGSTMDRLNFHTKVLEFNQLLVNKNNALLADISEITALTPQIISTVNRMQGYDDQIRALQMQTAATIIMTHNHEMWLRSF